MSKVLNGIAGRFIKLSGAASLGAWGITQSVYTVEPGHRALIYDRFNGGIQGYTKGEGAHFLIPGIQRAVIMDCRTQPRAISTVTGTKDLQRVNLSLRVLSRPEIEHLPSLYKELDVDYIERILPSIGNEVLKAVVAKYNADQLLLLWDQISLEIKDSMVTRCSKFHLNLDDVSITHLNFSKDFAKAIEDKQVAEQMSERAKFIVAKSEQEKLALIIRSEGDAEAAKLVSEALKKAGKGMLELRRIEVAQSIAGNLAKNRNVTYLPSGNSNLLLNLPTDNGRQ